MGASVEPMSNEEAITKLAPVLKAAVELVCNRNWVLHDLSPEEEALEAALRDNGWIESPPNWVGVDFGQVKLIVAYDETLAALNAAITKATGKAP